jgi:hypothetical protein
VQHDEGTRDHLRNSSPAASRHQALLAVQAAGAGHYDAAYWHPRRNCESPATADRTIEAEDSLAEHCPLANSGLYVGYRRSCLGAGTIYQLFSLIAARTHQGVVYRFTCSLTTEVTLNRIQSR